MREGRVILVIRNQTKRKEHLLSHRNVPSLKCGSVAFTQHHLLPKAHRGAYPSCPFSPLAMVLLLLRSSHQQLRVLFLAVGTCYMISVYFYWNVIFLSSPFVLGVAK